MDPVVEEDGTARWFLGGRAVVVVVVVVVDDAMSSLVEICQILSVSSSCATDGGGSGGDCGKDASPGEEA